MSFKKTLLVGVASAVATAGVVGLGVTSASTDSGEKANLKDKVTMKFAADKGEVHAGSGEGVVFNHVEMEENFEERLDTAIAEGKLTAEQKDKIIAKRAEMRDQMESDRLKLKDMTKEEMQSTLQERHKALKQWAEENGISMEYLFGPGMHVAGSQPPSAGTSAQPTLEVRQNANE